MKDNELLRIPKLKWLPWIGENYLKSNSKILIVGESHYAKDNIERLEDFNNVEMTRLCILDMGVNNNKYHVKFYQNIHALFVQNKKINTKEFWSRVSFYNFIQTTLLTSGTRPKYDDFYNSTNTFFSLLEDLKPNYCLMCGVSSVNMIRAAINTSNFTEILFERKEKLNSVYPRLIKLQHKNGTIINLVFIKHPSKYFSPLNWRGFLNNYFLDMMNIFNDLE